MKKLKTGGLITLSQLRRGTGGKIRCNAGRKTFDAVCVKMSLLRGYREMGKLNAEIAEECLPADNEALSTGEHILTECEQKWL